MKALAAVLATGVAAIGGYVVGTSSAADEQDARQVKYEAQRSAYMDAFRKSSRSARATGRAEGTKSGLAKGAKKGKSAGASAGKNDAAETAAKQAAATEQRTATWPSDAYAQCEAGGGQVGQAPDEWGTGAGTPQCVP